MKKIILLNLLFLGTINTILAQNPAPPAAFDIYTTIHNSNSQPSVADILAGTATIQNDSADYSLRIVISVLDTLNISKIYLDIGNTIGSSNIYNDSIPFNNLNGINQYREKNIIYIETDTLYNLGAIYGTVFLKDNSGNLSATVSFTSN